VCTDTAGLIGQGLFGWVTGLTGIKFILIINKNIEKKSKNALKKL
jgi:hypothetical protein